MKTSFSQYGDSSRNGNSRHRPPIIPLIPASWRCGNREHWCAPLAPATAGRAAPRRSLHRVAVCCSVLHCVSLEISFADNCNTRHRSLTYVWKDELHESRISAFCAFPTPSRSCVPKVPIRSGSMRGSKTHDNPFTNDSPGNDNRNGHLDEDGEV